MTDTAVLLARFEALYRDAVTAPEAWSDDELARWADDLFIEPPPREILPHVRRGMRMARKLAAFWSADQPTASDAGDWRSRVDIALGPPAWGPLLEIARDGLDRDPGPELFAEVQRLFREVNGAEWMDGMSYAQWTEAGMAPARTNHVPG